MLRRLVTSKKLLVIVPVVLALALAGLFLPARRVTIEPYGMLSLESKIVISVGYEVAYASPAAPVYQEYTEAKVAAAATSVLVATPAGTSDGDLLVAGMTTDNVTTITEPAGWAEISQGSSGGKVTAGSWWKIASSEPADYTFQTADAELIYIFILRITGAHASTPVDASAFAIDETINPNCPTVTTNVADTLVLRLFGADESDITVDSGYPAGHTGIMVDTSGGSKPCSGGAAWIEQAAAGATGAASYTLLAAEEWYATTIAVKPPAPDITNTPASKDFGNVTTSTDYWSTVTNPPEWPLDDGECLFEVTNNTSVAVDIDIRATDFSGGALAGGWDLGSAPGENIVVLKAGASETTADENAMVILAIKDTDYDFILSLAAGSPKKWELKMETPTVFGNADTKTATITLTATLS